MSGSHLRTTAAPRSRALLAGLGIAVVVLTTACSSTPMASTASPAAAASTMSTMPSSEPSASASIVIKDFAFEVPATVPAGAMVTVSNEDSMSHTVTSNESGAFDVTVAGGETASFRAPTAAGSYKFVCSFHGNMKGTLVVS